MLRLTRADVELFATASGDRNPLHVSPAYARATAFGGPIAHGVLGLLKAADALPERFGQRLRRIAVEFPRPLLLDIDYAVDVHEQGPDACAIEVRDGSKPALRGVLEFGESGESGELGASGIAWLEPAQRTVAIKRREFTRGEVVGGAFAFADHRLGHGLDALGNKGIDRLSLRALMLCSYVVGMELPGELALFTRLALEFHTQPRAGEALTWEARVDSWQPRTGALRIGLTVRSGELVWVSGSLRAFVRADAAALDDANTHGVDADPLAPDAFAGKTALVIGASRGLGRSFARSFAAHGGRTLAVSRSPIDALRNASGSLIPIEADASNPEQLARALDGIEQLDLLVCNASPPLQPLTLEPATAARILVHIQQAVALVSTPLALCLPRLARAKGFALLSSSQAVITPPSEWAHYVAGKRAAEGLFEVAALQYPEVGFLIARMPRLATAFSLNVAGEPAASAHAVALQLLERVAATHPERGTVELIQQFSRARA